MKLVKKNISLFLLLCFLGLLSGTLAWELLERILSHSGVAVNMTTNPVGFDLFVLSVYMRINPGSVAGGIAGFFLFRSL